MKIDPNHIKIDTDGNELKILKSGINLFNSNNLFSISIEIDESNQDECDEIINFLSSYKFEISSKETTGSSNKYLYNYIFKRST